MASVLFRVIQISQFMNADIKVVDEYSLLSTSQHLLQPDNILVCSEGQYPLIQISDFSLACREKQHSKARGTLAYLPPEAIAAHHSNGKLKYYGCPADCWSAGLLMFVLLTYENSPFSEAH